MGQRTGGAPAHPTHPLDMGSWKILEQIIQKQTQAGLEPAGIYRDKVA